MNVPVSSNHPQSYAIIQGSQPPILATASTTSGTPLQHGHQPIAGGGDVHICGACGAQFTEIKEFVAHKRQGCQANNTVGTATNVPQPQLQSPSAVHQTHPAHSSVQMGVPVGMPHVILQTASGPPQMYRIVLEPSVTTSSSQSTSIQGPAPILAQALSGGPVPHLTSSLGHHPHTHSHAHHSPHSQQEGAVSQVVGGTSATNGASNGSLLQLAHVGETWHTGGAPTVEREGNSVIDGNGQRRVLVEGTPGERPLEGNPGGGNNGTPTGSVDRRGGMEGDTGGTATTNNMHTEEEDVATFLATQLASQAAPPHTTTVVSEQVMSSVVNGVQQSSEGQLHYTSAPTQPHQHQQLQLGIQQHHQVDAYGSGVRSSGSGRRPIKGTTIEESSHSNVNVESKVDVLGACPKETLVVHDGIHKEKACPMKDCNFTTSHNKDLHRHIRKHTGEKPYRCEECGTCFSRGDKLKVHSRIHSNIRPYWCQEPGCQYRAIDSGSLRKHMRTHTNERPYRCQLCPYSARDGSQLTVHLRTHTGDTPFQCMIENCSAAFKTSSDLRRHERLHTGLKPYKCSACDYACAIKSNLTVHMRLNHFKGAKFSCTKCDFLGNSRKQLKDHEKSHANVLLQCDLCDHVSTSSTGLRQHMLIHSQEKPFQCRYCSFTCKTTGNLRYHVRNKHGCDVSGRKRGTPGNGGVGGRGRNSTGGGSGGGRRASRPSCYRSFKCSECGSGFVREDSYRSHMRQHEKHKMAQAISGKMEPDVFSVVVQDEGLIGVDQPTGPDDPTATGGGVTTFQAVHRIPSDSLQPGTLISQSAVASGTGTQGNENVNGYSSYVITIDGISTVFSNPVRLAGNTVTTETGDPLPGTVQVITGDLITSPGSKVSTGHQTYDLNEDDKTAASQHYEITQQDKVSQTQHLYDLTPADKVDHGQPTFNPPQEQVDAGSSREYIAHTASQDMQQTVLVEQQQQNIDDNLDNPIQVHNLSAKPKTE